ncbi:MAG: hypothetical protein AAGA36_00315 [Pseudomonadota bacterium]
MMRSVSEILTELGITTRYADRASFVSTCPQCSHTRKKKKQPCLSVKIDGRGVMYCCHHCGWKGAKLYAEQGTRSVSESTGNQRRNRAKMRAALARNYDL